MPGSINQKARIGMAGKIKIGIVGYGNLGRGVESAIAQNGDMEVTAVFPRRDPGSVDLLDSSVPVRPPASVAQFKDDHDVVILCGGSKNDLPGLRSEEHTSEIQSLIRIDLAD